MAKLTKEQFKKLKQYSVVECVRADIDRRYVFVLVEDYVWLEVLEPYGCYFRTPDKLWEEYDNILVLSLPKIYKPRDWKK